MLVRFTDAYGNGMEIPVDTSPYPDLTAHDLAMALMAGLPEMACVRVWNVGRSSLDVPDAVVERSKMPAALTAPDLGDIATAMGLGNGALDEVPETVRPSISRNRVHVFGPRPPV